MTERAGLDPQRPPRLLATNLLGRALYAPLFDDPAAGEHRPLHLPRPSAPGLLPRLGSTANDMVAMLRAEAGRNPYDSG